MLYTSERLAQCSWVNVHMSTCRQDSQSDTPRSTDGSTAFTASSGGPTVGHTSGTHTAARNFDRLLSIASTHARLVPTVNYHMQEVAAEAVLQDVERLSCQSTARILQRRHKPSSLLCIQGAQSQMRDAVLQQYTRLQQELASSDVLELPAGVPYLLRSSAVLLKGTLKVSGRPYVEGKKGWAFYVVFLLCCTFLNHKWF